MSAAEVPMPELNYDGYDLIDRFLRNNLDDDDYAEYMSGLQQCGDTREAAGYARGIADRFDLAHELEGIQADVDQRHNFDATCRNTLARVIAALRGEVKP